MQLRGNRVALIFGASECADREMYCALPLSSLLRDLGYHVFQLLDPTQGQLAEGLPAPLAFETLTAFGRCLHASVRLSTHAGMSHGLSCFPSGPSSALLHESSCLPDS
jgi:hypothetical protein